jgi:hypothetical protein
MRLSVGMANTHHDANHAKRETGHKKIDTWL